MCILLFLSINFPNTKRRQIENITWVIKPVKYSSALTLLKGVFYINLSLGSIRHTLIRAIQQKVNSSQLENKITIITSRGATNSAIVDSKINYEVKFFLDTFVKVFFL